MTRTLEEVGRGLAPDRPARLVPTGERIHILGGGGAGASEAALLAAYAGASVTACDAGGPSPYTAAAEALGIPFSWAHSPAHVVDTAGRPIVDRLSVTKSLTSVDPDHPELRAATAAGIAVEAWQQVVADVALTAGQRLLAVTGTHGKSTTSGWVTHLLVGAGRDPSAAIGALLPVDLSGSPAATARWGRGSWMVVEADEYADNFAPYHPAVAVILNAEWDHPDVFADRAAVVDMLVTWVRASPTPPLVVVNLGDPGGREVAARLADLGGRLRPFALLGPDGPAAGDLPAGTVTGWIASAGPEGDRLAISGLPGGDIMADVHLPGRQYAADALAAATAGAAADLAPAQIAAGLASFRGVGRRLELKGEPRGIAVLDDYGHHPTAIRGTLAAVRQRYPGRRVWAVYEPLTFHRTAAMLDAFAEVLATADRAVIADIWANRDPDRTTTSAQALADATSARASGWQATAPGSPEATADHLAARVEPGDVVLVMGGGRSYVIAERLTELLSRAPGARELREGREAPGR
ncbi:MAG TPA: cyanophycin synthetase [Candidatus Sulfotelmatobacter sp.]|nr:cyanophycin synthetase [Candidatus Sulfotelmatobacter sp.]